VTLLAAYYLATPLFAALDLGLSVPIRAVGVESPAARMGYYAATFALGWVMRARPRLAPWLAMGESAVNLTLLMAAVLVPIWSLGETMDFAVADELPSRVLNLSLSGSVLVYSFYRSQARTGLQGSEIRRP
jgi:hypothetical protein